MSENRENKIAFLNIMGSKLEFLVLIFKIVFCVVQIKDSRWNVFFYIVVEIWFHLLLFIDHNIQICGDVVTVSNFLRAWKLEVISFSEYFLEFTM